VAARNWRRCMSAVYCSSLEFVMNWRVLAL